MPVVVVSWERANAWDARGMLSVNASSRSCPDYPRKATDVDRTVSATDVHDPVNVVAIDESCDVV